MPDAIAEHNSIEIRESCIIESIDAPGHAVRATVIKGGKSINGYYYDDHALQSIAQMLEGAHSYADHGGSTTRSMRDLVGFYKDAQFIPASGSTPAHVDATLHILESADWLWKIIQESHAINKPDLIGLSIDIFGQAEHDPALDAKAIKRVHALNSCDVVTKPSAGGSINRILHSVGDTNTEGNHTSMETETVTPPVVTPVATVAPTSTPPVVQAPVVNQATAEQMKEAIAQNNALLEKMQVLDEQKAKMEALENKLRLGESQLLLSQCLQESILPAAAKEQIKQKFAGRIFEASELQAEMTGMLNMMSQLVKDGIVRGHGYDKAEISGQITEAEKVQAAFDAMFDLEIDRSKYGNIRGFTSIREAYARVTGTSSLMAGISSVTQLGSIGIHESAPVDRITEADTTTASFSYLLGTSMNKRLLKDYQAWPAEWMKFVTIAPIRDFKQQTRVRLGAFASLPIVAEDSAYSAVTLQDSASTYVPQKRGNLVTVSRETIINDDLQSIKQIPTKLAVAAAYTLAEFVYGFLSSNPTIYDGNALFTSGGAHSNLGSANLSTSAMQTGITAMREQTNFAGKRLGLRPRFLIVPPELEFVAMVVTKSAGVPGSNNNDINPMLGYCTPIVSPQLSSSTQWFLAGDPREIDTIEIGFVGGQVNPALFIQDSPLLGLNFTQDAVSYKIRHEYGGAVTDFRGLYRGI